MTANTTHSISSQTPALTERTKLLAQINETKIYDLVVIGGGATGLGVALDGASRGLKVLLLEAFDFAKGTSSRATKLVHGGVRYLAQGNISLVKEALHERATLLRNANHLAKPLSFVMPSYKFWETAFYGTGLKMYDALAGRNGLGSTALLGSKKVTAMLPNVLPRNLHGGVQYWDGQFDDARLALALARTAALHGAHLLNYAPVHEILHDAQGQVSGLVAKDTESAAEIRVHGKCIINATGVWVDTLRKRDAAAQNKTVQDLVAPSQGVHLVVDKEFWPSEHALLVPKTRDGRVLFSVPWLGKVVLGTTDTPRQDIPQEPIAQEQEIRFILDEAARYLAKAPKRSDVLSIWAGLRPLAKANSQAGETKTISREHTIEVASSGLVTVTGGKWTTYRAMAQDVLHQCQLAHLLPVNVAACQTQDLPLVGAQALTEATFKEGLEASQAGITQILGLSAYGQESDYVASLPGAERVLSAETGLTEAMVRFAVRYEYARTVEDVLARRCRLLFLNAQAAQNVAPEVDAIMRSESIEEPQLAAFLSLAQQYQLQEA